MSAFNRLRELLRSRHRVSISSFVADARDLYPGRVDAQLGLLMETVWAAEKIWRLEDRIEGTISDTAIQKARLK